MTLVSPAALHELASARAEVEADSQLRGSHYITDHIAELDSGGYVSLLMSQHRATVESLEGNARAAHDLLERVSAKLHETYLRYSSTEDKNVVQVADIFAALGTDPRYKGDDGLGHGGGAFQTSVATVRDPVPMEAIPEWTLMVIEMGGELLHPSYWIANVCRLVFGNDPWEWVGEHAAGDYRAISTVADALSVLGSFYEQVSALLEDDASVLFAGWSGEAADSAIPYFRELIEQFAAQRGPIDELSALYVQFAWSAFYGAKAVALLLGMIIDEVISRGIEALALVAGVETGPGDLGIAAIFELWIKAMEIHTAVCSACFGLVSSMAGITASAQHVSLAQFTQG